MRRGPSAFARLERHPVLVCLVFAAPGLASVAALPALRFDFDVVRMRDPDSESVRAFQDLA